MSARLNSSSLVVVPVITGAPSGTGVIVIVAVPAALAPSPLADVAARTLTLPVVTLLLFGVKRKPWPAVTKSITLPAVIGVVPLGI